METEKLTKQDKELIKLAKSMTGEKEVSGGIIKQVGCALKTKKGKIFTGASLHLACGIGFCAEHSAISNMVSHSDETEIDTLAASGPNNVGYPCGRCRELMELIDEKNRKNTWIIISDEEKVKLEDILPGEWW